MAILSDLMKRLFHLASPSSKTTVGADVRLKVATVGRGLFTEGCHWSEREGGW